MRRITALVVGLALSIAVFGCSRPTGIAAAADAMGAAKLNSIQFAGSGSLVSGANTGASLSQTGSLITVTDTTGASYLTLWPTGQPRPTASSLNWPAGDTRPNLVVAKVGDLTLVHVGHVDGAIGAHLHVHRPKPWVGRSDRMADVPRLE